MSKANFYRHGDYNVICDTCGFKQKASRCKLQWNNFLVCKQCFEERNVQEFVRGRFDKQAVPLARPDSTPRFRETNINTEDL